MNRPQEVERCCRSRDLFRQISLDGRIGVAQDLDIVLPGFVEGGKPSLFIQAWHPRLNKEIPVRCPIKASDPGFLDKVLDNRKARYIFFMVSLPGETSLKQNPSSHGV